MYNDFVLMHVLVVVGLCVVVGVLGKVVKVLSSIDMGIMLLHERDEYWRELMKDE